MDRGPWENVSYEFVQTFLAVLRKKTRFILSEQSVFHLIDNLLIAIHVFTKRMLTSADEILLPRYLNFFY